ncbi:MAG TPA: hypothetical protein VNQ80_02220 [Parapedobacter sp.]|uniref:hypothetical protein n=1 Tax=Parapedobacter sp. TaxID=1958893 RepID=UPI002BBE69BF|nr:hypothetical protein [Parapedobacter sp.]HWK56123.1 hypothetical protein [Parapedobacter sp.]
MDDNITPIVDRDSTPTNPPSEGEGEGEGHDDDSKLMRFEIEFAADAANATIQPAMLKFNKRGWVSIEWDDNSLEALKALPYLDERYYTDGCGNRINYSAAVAVNGRNQYHNEEAGLMSTNVTYAQMKMLIAKGWDMENHSYYHEPTGNYNYGNDRARNVSELDELIYDRIGYRMNGLVVPTNYDGFPSAAKDFGYLFSTSQGTFDDLPPAGNPTYKDVQDFDLAPKDFSSFNRMFYDDWNEMNKAVTAAFAEIITKKNHYFRIASHRVDEQIFGGLMELFEKSGKDNILIIPTREAMEYRIMADLPISYVFQENKLLVEIDASTLPDRFRWRDLSFLVKPVGIITGVKTVSNIDRISFNAETGLVNIFKQVTAWE